jgi:hypothetical protein
LALLAAICGAWLAGCAPNRPAALPDEVVVLGPGIEVVLPPSPEPGRRVEAAQTIIAEFTGQRQMFEARISAAPGRFAMAAVDTLGRRALTLEWTAAGLSATAAPWVPERMRVRNLLADMMLIYWPEEAVRALLSQSEARLDASRTRRRVLRGSEEVIRVEYAPAADRPWSGTTRFFNRAWGYAITVHSAEVGG